MKHIFNYILIKFRNLTYFFKSKPKKEPVLFCEETQQIINFKLAKNRTTSGKVDLIFDNEKETFEYINKKNKQK